jgi:hypothetical protein
MLLRSFEEPIMQHRQNGQGHADLGGTVFSDAFNDFGVHSLDILFSYVREEACRQIGEERLKLRG